MAKIVHVLSVVNGPKEKVSDQFWKRKNYFIINEVLTMISHIK